MSRLILAVDDILARALRYEPHCDTFEFERVDPFNARGFTKVVRAAEVEGAVLVVGSIGWDPLPILERAKPDPRRLPTIAVVDVCPEAMRQHAGALGIYSVVPLGTYRQRRVETIAAECLLAERRRRYQAEDDLRAKVLYEEPRSRLVVAGKRETPQKRGKSAPVYVLPGVNRAAVRR